MPDHASVMRLRRPRWRDPRLLVGIVLVLVSVLLGALVVSRYAETTQVLVVREAVAVGEELDPDALATAEVRLGAQQQHYATSVADVPAGALALRSLHPGELVPLSAVGQSLETPLRPVVVPVDSAVAESVGVGRSVELWRTGTGSGGDEDPVAERLVDQAVVHAITDGSALGMQSMSVEVLVPADSLAEVLEAVADGHRLDVIGIPRAHEVTG